MKRSNGIILGLLAGAAFGAIAGILMAPDRGSNTIKRMSRKGKDTLDNLSSRISDIKDRAFGAGLRESNDIAQNLERTRSTASKFNSH